MAITNVEGAVILILGAANSGKSTLFKQIRIIHKYGFQKVERRSCIPLVASNMLESMQSVLKIMQETKEELDESEIMIHENFNSWGKISNITDIQTADNNLSY